MVDISRKHFDVTASKFMIQSGISEYIIRTHEGICALPTKDLYTLSFADIK